MTITRLTCPEQTTELDGSDRQSDCAVSAPREKHGIENVGFLDLSEIIKVIKPLFVKGPGTGAVSGISIDTRKPIGEDYIFWAIKGRNFNGNDFVEEALSLGVKAAVVSRPDLLEKELAEKATLILVPDTVKALQDLAASYRQCFTFPIIGITGSNGKTLVKEMLASILCLERKTYRSPLSYNTQVGAALGLLGMRPEHQVAIIEAGISLPGEMDRLERMIRPDDGILTIVSKAHIGGLGSLEKTLEEKGKLFTNLNEDSFLLLNLDDALSMNLSSQVRARVVTFGLSQAADVTAEDLVSVRDHGHRFKIRLFGNTLNVMLPVPGLFNVLNSLAAAAAATLLGASPAAVRQGLENFRPSPMRLEFHTDVTGVTLINDTYNSDPASVKGALDVLAKVGTGRRKVAILSDMLDLGPYSSEEHLAVGKDVVRAEVDHLITVGENAALIGRAAAEEGMNARRIVNTHSYNDAAQELEKIMTSGDVVLFKGSRWFRLERIARELVGSIGPTRLVVNLDAIAANTKAIRRAVGEDIAIMAVVKSFGYGNDSIRVSRTVLENGANYLAVAFPDEAATLRENRVDAPILVFHVLPEEVDRVIRYRLASMISSLEPARALNSAATGTKKIPVHIKVDTGMGRSGVWVDEAIPFIEEVLCLKNLEVEGIMTHFSSADDPEADEYTLGQIDAFQSLLAELKRRGHDIPYVHAANTAAAVRFPQTRYNMVRPGLAIYGMYPSEAVKHLIRVEPVITFCTKIAQIKEHPVGRYISYSRRFVTSKNSRIATIPVGYNDGYPRFQSNCGQVLIRGLRVPVVGTVCMDATMVDISDVPEAQVGDEVVLIGRQGDEEILADEIAANGNTINYEIACKISPRVKRIFVQS